MSERMIDALVFTGALAIAFGLLFLVAKKGGFR